MLGVGVGWMSTGQGRDYFLSPLTRYKSKTLGAKDHHSLPLSHLFQITLTKISSIIMIAKIAVFLAVVAVGHCGLVSVASPPASTVKLANPVVAYSAPVVHAPIHAPVLAAAPAVTYAAGPIVAGPILRSAPATVVASGPIVAPGPISYSAPSIITKTFEPVEQHGYQIAY